MNLFTSNSKFLVSMLLGLAILVGYNFVLMYSSPAITKFPNQWIRNYSLAERYIYLGESPEVVIVGSSMAARLQEKIIHHDARNLSFVSAGATTGLEVIVRSGIFPKLLFVESNTIANNVDREMVDSLFTPIFWKVKRFFLFLQYQYQSVNLFISFFTNGTEKSANVTKKLVVSKDTLRMRMHPHLVSHADVTMLENIDYSILKETLSKITNQGTKIVFFRMPAAPELINSAVYRLTDEILARDFSEYPNISMTAEMVSHFQTTDGLHLGPFSAQVFSEGLARHAVSFLEMDI